MAADARCRQHARKPIALCDRCAALVCEGCSRELTSPKGEKYLVCSCGGHCERLGIADFVVPVGAFNTMLGESFRIPFHGNGLAVLLGGTIVFGVVAELSWMPFVGLAFALIGFGYLLSYLPTIVVHTTRGDPDLPDWPDFQGPWDSVIAPILHAVVTLGVPLVPAIVCHANGGPPALTGVLVLGWAFVAPMAYAIASLGDLGRAIDPRAVLASIGAVGAHYGVACCLVLLTVTAALVGRSVTKSVPIVGSFVAAFVTVYFLIVAMRSLGLVCLVNRKKLGWF